MTEYVEMIDVFVNLYANYDDIHIVDIIPNKDLPVFTKYSSHINYIKIIIHRNVTFEETDLLLKRAREIYRMTNPTPSFTIILSSLWEAVQAIGNDAKEYMLPVSMIKKIN